MGDPPPSPSAEREEQRQNLLRAFEKGLARWLRIAPLVWYRPPGFWGLWAKIYSCSWERGTRDVRPQQVRPVRASPHGKGTAVRSVSDLCRGSPGGRTLYASPGQPEIQSTVGPIDQGGG